MIKHTLMILLGCLAVTACTTMKETTEPKQSLTPVVQTEESSSVPVDPITEITTLLTNQKVDISIREKTMTPEGNLVLTLNGNKYFGDGATITINADKLDDLQDVVSKMKFVMDQSAKQSNKIKALNFQNENQVPVIDK